MESAFLFAGAVRSGADFIAGLGSLEKLILDAELSRYVLHMLKPLEFSEEAMAVELMISMGREANYIQSDHTFEHSKEIYQPEIFRRYSYVLWEDQREPDLFTAAAEKVEQLQESYRKPYILPRSVLKDMDAYMSKKSGVCG